MDNENTNNNEEMGSENVTYAGKYKTPEDLEQGYLDLVKAYSNKNSTQAQYNDLKKAVTPPGHYKAIETEIELSDDFVEDVRTDAKSMGLTQTQFDNYMKNRVDSHVKSLGSERNRVSKLKEKFGDDHFSKLNTWIKDERGFSENEVKSFSLDTFNRLNQERSQSLDTITSVTSSNHVAVSSEDITNAFVSAYAAKEKGDMVEYDRCKKRYQNLGGPAEFN